MMRTAPTEKGDSILTVLLTTIYDPTPYKNCHVNDIPDDAWEILKKFDLEKSADVRDFFTQLKHWYFDKDALEILEIILCRGLFTDYENWYRFELLK